MEYNHVKPTEDLDDAIDPADCRCPARAGSASPHHQGDRLDQAERGSDSAVGATRQNTRSRALWTTILFDPSKCISAVRARSQIAVRDRREPIGSGCRNRTVASADYLAAPAIYAATIYVACLTSVRRSH